MALTLGDIASGMPPDVTLAVVIAGEPITRTPGGRHAGFVVRADDGKLLLFDLAWHNIFRQSEITADYGYLRLEFLDPANEWTMIGFLMTLLATSKGRIPYSIGYDIKPIDYFSAEATFQRTQLGDGLTCSTFVLETFRRYGFDLLDRDTWPITEEMKNRQHDLVLMLKKHAEDFGPAEFLAQFQMIGRYPRYSPEEVVGAANYFESEPLSYEQVQPAAGEVLDQLVQQYKDWPKDIVSRWSSSLKRAPGKVGNLG